MPEFILKTPEGELEIRYNEALKADALSVIVLHPHPEHGGTMNNKVVYTIYQTFLDQGFNVVRFNFRGVGKSSGYFDFGEGELRDAQYVLQWMQQTFKNTQDIWIAGFSFGSWVALQLLKKEPKISRFVCAAPPVNVYDFSFMLPCTRDGLFIQGTTDTIVNPFSTQALTDKINRMSEVSAECQTVEGGDHFFTGKLDQLTEILKTYIHEQRGIN